jgi:hypothetical protein
LGDTEKTAKLINGKREIFLEAHTFCGTRSRVGKECGELFKFCPRCMIKTESKEFIKDNK